MAKVVGIIDSNLTLNYHLKVLRKAVSVYNYGIVIFLNGMTLLLRQILIFTLGFLWYTTSVGVLSHFRLLERLVRER